MAGRHRGQTHDSRRADDSGRQGQGQRQGQGADAPCPRPIFRDRAGFDPFTIAECGRSEGEDSLTSSAALRPGPLAPSGGPGGHRAAIQASGGKAGGSLG